MTRFKGIARACTVALAASLMMGFVGCGTKEAPPVEAKPKAGAGRQTEERRGKAVKEAKDVKKLLDANAKAKEKAVDEATK